MTVKNVLFGLLAVLVTASCSKDEVLDESVNSFTDPETTNHRIENEIQFSGKSRALSSNLNSDIPDNPGRSLLNFPSLIPLCTDIEEGDYFPVRVTYSNFSSDMHYVRVHKISSIRHGYDRHYNMNRGDCIRIIIPSDFDSITCERDTCSEIWYFFQDTFFEIKPEGGGTVDIDVEAPGP